MSSGPVIRRLSALMSADVKGYARLMGEDELATVRTLTLYREVIGDLVQRRQPREANTGPPRRANWVA